MKKAVFFIIILVATVFFSTTDYYFNTRGSATQLPTDVPSSQTEDPKEAKPLPNLTQAMLNADAKQYGYQIASRVRTAEMFERIDLSKIENVAIFRNDLEPISSSNDVLPMVVYEVQGPLAQGSLTYLAAKLEFIKQKDEAESLNETGDYAHNSFFFNDSSYPETAFLVTQIGDSVYGFQYSKPSTATFDAVKNMIALWEKTIKIQ